MEIKYFKLLVAIAEIGSITKAADKLFLTPSALSHQLKELESQLNARLFKRVNKKLILTNAGQTFLRYSYTILHEIERLEVDFRNQVSGESGIIKLTTESSTCYHWLPKILKRYQQDYPNVEVRLGAGPLNKPLKLLLTGKVDIAIMHSKQPDKNIAYKNLLNDEVVALVQPSDPLLSKSFLKPQDFAMQNYISHSQNLDESAFFESFFRPHNVVPKKVIHFHLTEAIIEMVKEGLGVAVMSNWLARPYIQSGAVKSIRITKNGFKRQWAIATLKHDQSQYLTKFVQHLSEGVAVL